MKLIHKITSLFGFVKDIPYGWLTEKENMNLFFPSFGKNRKKKLIVFIHGGGFVAGDKESGDKYAIRHARNGYFCATVGYTLLNGIADLATMDREIYLAVCKLKEYISKNFGIEIEEMAVEGISAGGALALLYAYKHKADSPVKIKCAIAKVAPTCFKGSLWHNSDYYKAITNGMKDDEFFENKLSGKKGYEVISPVTYIAELSVPTLLAYAGKDRLVPETQKAMIIEKLRSFNIPYQCVDYPNSEHDCGNDPDSDRDFEFYKDFMLRAYL